MAHTNTNSHEKLDELSLALDSGTLSAARRMLNGLPTADVAHLLESSPPRFRHVLWQLVKIEREGEVLGELSDELQLLFLSKMDAAEVAVITEGLEDTISPTYSSNCPAESPAKSSTPWIIRTGRAWSRY